MIYLQKIQKKKLRIYKKRFHKDYQIIHVLIHLRHFYTKFKVPQQILKRMMLYRFLFWIGFTLFFNESERATGVRL